MAGSSSRRSQRDKGSRGTKRTDSSSSTSPVPEKRPRRSRRRQTDDDDEEVDLRQKQEDFHRHQTKDEEEDVEEGEVIEEEESRGGGDAESLSIEETNKLRAKLGLAPLDIPGSSKKTTEEEEDSYEKRGEVFVKTENISDKIETEKIKERLAAQREKRRILDKLSKTKGLADSSSSSDDEEGALSWVEKSRQLERLKAEQKARELEELDREIQRQEEEKQKEFLARQRAYKETDLKGMAVSHSFDSIKEGQAVVLTLKDKEVLDDEEEDVLENVNIVDEEKAAENVSNKKKGKQDYNPYEIDDDSDGRNLLSKYDEAIHGKKKESFRLGSDQVVNMKEQMEKLKQEEIEGKIKFSLDDVGIKGIASEFYTHQEMEQFKKPKKVKGKKKVLRKRNIEEEIVPLNVPSSSSSSDFGSRRNRSQIKQETDDDKGFSSTSSSSQSKLDVSRIKQEVLDQNMDSDDEEDSVDRDMSSVVIDDDADQELQEALERARKLRERQAKSEVDTVVKIAKEISVKREEDNSIPSTITSGTIIMDATAEFCRNLGDLSFATTKIKEESESEDEEMEEGEDDGRQQEEDPMEIIRRLREEKKRGKQTATVTSSSFSNRTGDWREVDLDAEEEEYFAREGLPSSSSHHHKKKHKEIKAVPILEEEPDVSVGVAAALKLAKTKGYLEEDPSNKKSASVSTRKSGIEAEKYTIEEKFYEEDRGRRERYSGALQEFKDKPGYKPDVKLDYVDDNGRLLSAKEAFRTLSHKFHGKGPGKNKIDKRQQKLEKESKLRQMSSIDTPLNTVHKLQEKTKELQLPYVVISGSGTSLIKK